MAQPKPPSKTPSRTQSRTPRPPADQLKARLLAANALFKQGRLSEARQALRELVRRAPSLAEGWVGLAHAARAEHDHREALAAFEKAAKLRPGDRSLLAACAQELTELGQTGRAITLLDRLIATQPGDLKARAEKARLLQLEGDFAGAERAFRAALDIAPDNGELYRIFLATKKLQADDPLIARMERAWARDDLPPLSRAHLGFALAKAMEDSGQTERVFGYLRPANEGIRALHPYDITAREREIDDLIALFRAHDFASLAPPEPGAFNPVFVTGLPRSGTTLIEQIIASHPKVTGAGELPLFGRAAMRLLSDPSGGYVPLGDIPAQGWAALGADYERAVQKRMGRVGHVTDKAIQTYMVLGPMRLALPSARAIVVRRDPRDTLLSIYMNVFAAGSHLYAYDLVDLARYYRSFERMVDFWREAMPEGFTEVRYEDVVADPEPQSRALGAAAGLEWDPACLEFTGNRRRVDTLSTFQVRQPLYSSSVAKWKRYEGDLSEMLEELERPR
ncbi:MAG: sulfotransferase [Roseicyclus sp.]|nr:sulfotransferase [Roseicyclus sp.]